MDFTGIIGTKVIYEDYLGIEHIASIGWAEQYMGENVPVDYTGEEIIAWLYLVDENPERNIHEIIANDQTIYYTEMRLSTEVGLLEEGNQ